jgi:excisionase family DNA binding protein
MAETYLATDVPLLVDSKEAARLLGLSTRTVWAITDKGQLPVVRIGRLVRYAIDDIRDFARRQRVVDQDSREQEGSAE